LFVVALALAARPIRSDLTACFFRGCILPGMGRPDVGAPVPNFDNCCFVIVGVGSARGKFL
jgi:hypothetical protein